MALILTLMCSCFHEHHYNQDYSYDDVNHWFACNGCGEMKDVEEHSWDEGAVTVNPTENSEGEKTFTCTVCNATKVEKLDKLQSVENIDMESKIINVYLIGGQSNAVGIGRDSENKVLNSDPRLVSGFDNVLYFTDQEHTSKGSLISTQFEPVKFGLGIETDACGAEVGIASMLADNGEMNAIIKCAWGGANIYPYTKAPVSIEQGTWTPPSYIDKYNLDAVNEPIIGGLYRRFEETVTKGLELLIQEGYTPVIKGMWWMQGESEMADPTMSGAYYELLSLLIGDVRSFLSETTGYDCSQMPFVCGLPKYNTNLGTKPQYQDVVRNAISSVSNDLVNVSCVDCMPLNQIDIWHFDASGQMYLGENFIKEVQKIEQADVDKLVSFNKVNLLAKDHGLEFIAKLADYQVDNKYEYGFIVTLKNGNDVYKNIKCEVFGVSNGEFYDIYFKGQLTDIGYEDFNTNYNVVAYVKDQEGNFVYSNEIGVCISVIASKELYNNPNDADVKNIVNAGVNYQLNVSESEAYKESDLDLIVKDEINLINSQNSKSTNLNVVQSPNMNYYVKYSSDNESVVTVDELGNITVHSAGKANVIVECGGKTKTVKVNVENQVIDGVTYDGVVSQGEYIGNSITKSNENTTVTINGMVVNHNIHLSFVITHGEWSKLNREWHFNDNIEMYIDGNKYIIQFTEGVVKFPEGVTQGVVKTTEENGTLVTTVEMCISGNKDKYKLMLALAGNGFAWLPALWERSDQPNITVEGLEVVGENSDYTIVSDGNAFVPTLEANNNIYSSNYGYAGLTDGIFDESNGRFSTKDGANGVQTFADATMSLDVRYTLHNIRFYYFYESWVEGSHKYPSYAGSNIKLEVYNDGAWSTVFDYNSSELSKYVVTSGPAVGNSYLEFDLDGIKAEKIRFSSDNALTGKSISYYEIEIYAYKDSAEELSEINVLEGKEFIPTEAANNDIYGASYGYATLTDGVISNDSGRFSTKDAASIMDATVDLKANYALSYIKLYYFFEWWKVGSENYTYVGADLKLEVLNDGVWETVFDYTFAELAEFVVSRGTANPGDGYLEIDLHGVRAEQVRISSSAGNGTTISYYEIELFAERP